MKYKCPMAPSRPYRILTSLGILTILFVGCASRKLPAKAASALHESVVQWAGGEITYEIVSAQKAGAGAEEVTIPTGINPDTSQLGACPPAGTSETWCVVIAPAIIDREGNSVSHILVQSQGRYWDAQKLLDTDQPVFEVQGCANWDAP